MLISLVFIPLRPICVELSAAQATSAAKGATLLELMVSNYFWGPRTAQKANPNIPEDFQQRALHS